MGKYVFRVLLCSFFVFLSSANLARAQDQSPKVAILPLAIHGQQDAAKARKSLEELLIQLCGSEGMQTAAAQDVSKFVKPGEAVQTEEQARSIGSKLGAEYALFGSFSQIGNSLSLDAKLVHVPGKKRTEILFAEERGVENLASAARKIVQQMAVHILSKAIIAEINVKGNERIEAEAIKNNVKSKKGEVLRPSQVSEDIKSIYKMGFFEKVDADVSDSPAGKVLTFVVQENPTIGVVKLTGNKKIKEKDINAAIATKSHTLLSRSLVNEDVQKIIKLYQQKGYSNAQVTSSIDFPKDPRNATVTFDIKEGKKVLIRSIEFSGNKHFSPRKLRGVMQTKRKSILSWVSDRGILQKDVLDSDVDRLTAFYHDEGYMDAKAGSPQVTQKPEGFQILIPVEEGSRYRVTDVRISGDLLPHYEKKIVKKLDLKRKAYFSREMVRHDMDLISKAYMDEGYARVEVDPLIKRNLEDHTTDVNFKVTQKEVVFIGRIFITGNSKTKDYVIRRELKLAEGEKFNSTKLEEALSHIKKLDYFEDVQFIPTDTEQTTVMNLNIKVKEKPTGSISVGGGYSSEDGLFVSGTIQQRNLWGQGDYIALKAYLGQKAQRYMLSYTEPWLWGYPIAVGFDVYDWLRDYQDFTKDAYGVRLRAGYPVGQWSHLNFFYVWENASITNIDPALANLPEYKNLSGIKSAPGVSFERDTTDHPFLPTKGSYAGVIAEWSSPQLGSDSDFFKHEYHAGMYHPLGIWKFIGHLRGETGFLIGDTDKIPIYERFFLGGINSLRGFDFGQVGPRTPVDVPNPPGPPIHESVIVGGTSYVVANAEILFPIMEKMGVRGVLFFDAGNAYNDFSEFNIGGLRTDAGGGLRWNSPFGPLRVEIGYNLDRRPGEDAYHWQFSAGAFF